MIVAIRSLRRFMSKRQIVGYERKSPNTIWHSVYSVTVANYPHTVEFDYTDTLPIKGFTWLPRQNGANGDIKDYKIAVSTDGQTWTEVMTGAFENSKSRKTVIFSAPVTARFVRLTALSSQNGSQIPRCADSWPQ